MDIMDHILARRSIRKYTPQPVEPEKLVLLLRAAMAAPSATNGQPWEFVVVTDPAVLERLRRTLFMGRYNAPAAIAVCGNMSRTKKIVADLFWVQDCSAAVENILIAAPGLGLGAVWIGVHPVPILVKPVSEVLSLPSYVLPLCVLYVGYPAEEKPARTQYDERKVHWQQYEP